MVIFALNFVTGLVEGAPSEVRGTWLTTTGSEDHIRSGAKTAIVMRDLQAIGLNTVYVETWKNGYTNYPSATLAAITDGPDRSTFLGTSRDLVEETLIHAHRHRLNYIGWFEYGFAAQFIGNGGLPSNPLATYMRDQGWLLQDQSGRYGNASSGFAWMNPAVPEVRQFLIDIVLEAVNRYDLDGIQFDDRLAWPKEFGWDVTTAQLYLEETGRALPSSVNNAHFRVWRQEKVTRFASELTHAVREARPNILLSVSPSITGFAETEYNADWPKWQDMGLFDEYIPQAYRSSLANFNAIVDAQVAPFAPDELGQLALGLRINGSGANTPSADVLAMIDRTRAEGAAGHSLWYSRGVRDEYSVDLAAYYNLAVQGPAANPHFGAEHRLSPVIGSPSPVGSGWWSFDVEVPARYRIVAQVGTLWKELGAVPLGAGEVELHLTDVSQVELLVDRRMPASSDFNADGYIDAADYVLWRKTSNSQLEYEMWRANFGASSGVVSVAVPEPTSIVFLLSTLILSIRREACVHIRSKSRGGSDLLCQKRLGRNGRRGECQSMVCFTPIGME